MFAALDAVGVPVQIHAESFDLGWHSFDLAHARYSGGPAPVSPDADPVSISSRLRSRR